MEKNKLRYLSQKQENRYMHEKQQQQKKDSKYFYTVKQDNYFLSRKIQYNLWMIFPSHMLFNYIPPLKKCYFAKFLCGKNLS